MTLNAEYHRDLQKGINPEIPCNYYEDDDPYNRPMLTWRNACNTLYSNWLNYYVYQTTDYILGEMDDFTYII
jgi:homoserine O-succinyltransferase